MKTLYKYKQVRYFTVNFDSERQVKLKGSDRVIRRILTLKEEHLRMYISSSLGFVHESDLGRKLVVDEYPDGELHEVITD